MSDQPFDMNLDELKQLIRLLRESNVTEFELRREGYRLRIRQGSSVEESAVSAPPRPVAAPTNGEEKTAAEMVVAPESLAAEKERFHEVRSPIVGTFYRSSSPGSSAFVEIGDLVRKNQVLCIVEAMKIMNEIESDIEGEICAIHAANGQPVEFGELLFSVRPVA